MIKNMHERNDKIEKRINYKIKSLNEKINALKDDKKKLLRKFDN